MKFNPIISYLPPPLQVQDTSFILCIVYMQPEIPVKQLKNLNTAPSSKLLYHRLDLLGQPSSCLHFKQLATVGKTPEPPSTARSDHWEGFKVAGRWERLRGVSIGRLDRSYYRAQWFSTGGVSGGLLFPLQ